MAQDIDWVEYEKRKAKIQNIGLKSWEYDEAIAQIVRDLESEADELHQGSGHEPRY